MKSHIKISGHSNVTIQLINDINKKKHTEMNRSIINFYDFSRLMSFFMCSWILASAFSIIDLVLDFFLTISRSLLISRGIRDPFSEIENQITEEERCDSRSIFRKWQSPD